MQQEALRCVFVTVPPLLSAIILQTFSERVVLRLVAELDSRSFLAECLPALAPDLLVIGMQPGEVDSIGSALLEIVPRACVLLVSNSAGHAYVYRMRPHRTQLSDFSPSTLLAAVIESADTGRIEPLDRTI